MTKAIYSLKVYLFMEQFKLTKREEKGICEICVFALRVYVNSGSKQTQPVVILETTFSSSKI
jgi:hypothetical protein